MSRKRQSQLNKPRGGSLERLKRREKASPTPIVPMQEGTKSSIGKVLAPLAIAAAGAGLYYCSHSDEPNEQATRQTSQQSPETADAETTKIKEEAAIDLAEHQSKIPDIQLSHIEAQFEPTQLVSPLPHEELLEMSKKVTEFAQNRFQSKVIPDLEKAGSNTDETQKISADFFMAILQFILDQHPDNIQPLNRIKPNIPQELRHLLLQTYINNFLLMQNMMLVPQGTYKGQHAFYNLAPVEKFKQGIITDQKTRKRTLVPIIYLNETLLPQSNISPKYRAVSVNFDPNTSVIYWRADELARRIKHPEMIREIQQYVPGYPNIEDLEIDETYDPVLKHECVHKFLKDQYPKDLQSPEDEKEPINISVKLKNGRVLKIKGDFHPVGLHELAGNGAELAFTKEKDRHIEQFLLLSKFDKNAPPTYRLIRMFLQEAFNDGSGSDPEKVALNSSVETINAVGKQMYDLAIILLEKRKKRIETTDTANQK